jgi:hypothetical protein
MMEAVRASETSVDNYFTRQYIPEDNSEHHTRRRENLKSHIYFLGLPYEQIFFPYEKFVGLTSHFVGTVKTGCID